MHAQISDDQIFEEWFLRIISNLEKTPEEIENITYILSCQKVNRDIVNKGVRSLACLPGNFNSILLEVILKNGYADVNATDASGVSALNNAISSHNNQAVEVLLERGASIECNNSLENYNSPLRTAICWKNDAAYDLLIKKGAPIDFNNAAIYFNLALGMSNEYVLHDLFQNHISKLKESIDDLMIDNFLTLNKNILNLFISKGVKEESLEKTFIKIISTNDPNNVQEIFLNKKINIEKAFANAFDINWGLALVRKYALDIKHKYSEFLKIVGNEDTTFDGYKEYFYQAKEVKKGYTDDLNIDQIMSLIFSQGGKNLISAIIKETSPDQHKELVKWLNVFGAKFSFYNSEKILLTSQPSGNESKNYQKDLDGEFINFKKMSKAEIRDRKLYNEHTKNIINGDKDQQFLYVIDKNGELYINVNYINVNDHSVFHHSYMLNGYSKKHSLDGISMFGYGKPVRCAGHLSVKDGVITQINNGSGHYKPDQNMFMQTCHTLLDLGILAENSVHDHEDKIVPFEQIRNFDVEEAISASGDYFFLDY